MTEELKGCGKDTFWYTCDQLVNCPLCKNKTAQVQAGRDFAVKCISCFRIRIGGFSSKEEAIVGWNNLCKPLITDAQVEAAALAIRTTLINDSSVIVAHEYLENSRILARAALKAAREVE